MKPQSLFSKKSAAILFAAASISLLPILAHADPEPDPAPDQAPKAVPARQSDLKVGSNEDSEPAEATAALSERLQPQVDALKKSQDDLANAQKDVQEIHGLISDTEDLVRSDKTLVKNIDHDRKESDRVFARNHGASDAAKTAHDAEDADYQATIDAANKQVGDAQSRLAAEREALGIAKKKQSDAKKAKDAAHNELKSSAKDLRIEQGCDQGDGGKAFNLGQDVKSVASHIEGGFLAAISPFRHRSALDQKEINDLVKSASCDNARMVNGRRLPREIPAPESDSVSDLLKQGAAARDAKARKAQ